MSGNAADVAALYKGRRDRVDIIDVPELGFASMTGRGGPEGPGFTSAVKTLYAISYAARSLVKRDRGETWRVMPLEALWWNDGSPHQDLLLAIAADAVRITDANRYNWRWQAMIAQPKLVDEQVFADALAEVRRRPGSDVTGVGFVRWREGTCAQTLHVGPYSGEAPARARLHDRIPACGYRPRDRHHEIYLSDPRRTAPENLRKLLRQPGEAAQSVA
jgi:hypothetical protein